VIHDKFTKRVSNINLNVENSNFEELSTINLGENQKIPKIDELFKKLKGKIGFQIEIKQKGLSKILLEKIRQYNVEDSVLISSFKHSELIEFRKLNSKIPLVTLEPFISGYIKSVFSDDAFLNEAIKTGVDGIHPKYTYVNEKFVNKAHDKDLIVNPWTVDKPDDWDYLMKCGVDGIITNDPRKLIEFLEKK
jgi:glycerophosphoryl diester phosphodiesterase